MAEQAKQIDLALLTAEQREELKAFTELFNSAGWRLLVQRAEPEIEKLQNSYHGVTDVHTLGKVQGMLSAYYRFFVHLPDLIHADFLSVTGQLQEIETGHEHDDPVTPDDWAG